MAVLATAPDCLRTRAALQIEVTRSSASTQRSAALGEATEADRCGSISLGPVVAVLDWLAVCPAHRETGDRDCLAPQGFPLALDLESSSRAIGATGGSGRGAKNWSER